MSFDISQVVTALGEEAIAKVGEPVGLSKEQSVRVAHAFAAKAGLGNEEMVRAVAADTGLDEEVVAAMLKKLVETGAEKLMNETPIGAAVDNAKQEAIAALGNAGDAAVKNAGGFLGRLFGRR
jgi:ATP phosphoribosyltransferase regulatory subunit HisZ